MFFLTCIAVFLIHPLVGLQFFWKLDDDAELNETKNAIVSATRNLGTNQIDINFFRERFSYFIPSILTLRFWYMIGSFVPVAFSLCFLLANSKMFGLSLFSYGTIYVFPFQPFATGLFLIIYIIVFLISKIQLEIFKPKTARHFFFHGLINFVFVCLLCQFIATHTDWIIYLHNQLGYEWGGGCRTGLIQAILYAWKLVPFSASNVSCPEYAYNPADIVLPLVFIVFAFVPCFIMVCPGLAQSTTSIVFKILRVIDRLLGNRYFDQHPIGLLCLTILVMSSCMAPVLILLRYIFL